MVNVAFHMIFPARAGARADLGDDVNRAIEASVRAAGLSDILEKVQLGRRISRADGVRLYRSKDLVAVGAMANLVRERRHGDRAYFIRNMHLNPTNVCT